MGRVADLGPTAKLTQFQAFFSELNKFTFKSDCNVTFESLAWRPN